MKSICFYFQIHQPFRLKRYRFFDIGSDHYYYDDYNDEEIIRRIANNCYLPANQTILNMIKESDGAFKVAYSISGVALEQMELYVPEVIDSFKELAKTGCVEFLAETFAHSLASLQEDSDEFELQVKQHSKKIQSLFGYKPTVFRNTELIYSDDIGSRVSAMGFKGIITEGAKHVLGWKSPNYVYCCASNPQLKVLCKNFKMSDDITFRFSDWGWDQYPLTAEKFLSWIENLPASEDVVNLFMNYETFGEMQNAGTGIFEFLKALPYFASQMGINFETPSMVLQKRKPIDQINVPYPISWADEERDLSAWLGNELQRSAFDKLYGIGERVRLSNDRRLLQDWYYLQSSDHFYYMSTKHFSDGAMHSHFSPYDTPYEAFMNYMNVLSDFIDRVNGQFPEGVDNEELNSLLKTIDAQGELIANLEKQLQNASLAEPKKKTAKKC
ncbi:MAG: glycoside hydrolase family 57 protein [Paludibacteraceae bacterium]|nr:alpha-amylase [Bacteroidales bacterium]MBO5132826.1 glycoside hydrolase family 57 protein [Paludibacteraceae bacterium]MBQ9100637.1 glycoside hydrolase family 57 protein [Paludibacteraceae bacterium]